MPTLPSFYQFLQQLLGPAPETPSAPQPQRTTDIALPGAAPSPTWTPELERLIEAEALKAGIDPQLGDRLVAQESTYNPKAAFPTQPKKLALQAVGLTQLRPLTAKEMGVTDCTDPEQSLRGGFGYLKKLIDRYDGDVRTALMAYNLGPTALTRAIALPPTPPREPKAAKVYHAQQKAYAQAQAYADRLLAPTQKAR